ncbi:MAG: aminopeptidase family protein P, partial [Alphaproteobacteria bacterium]
FPAPVARRLAEQCTTAGGELVPVETNLIDELWSDRPEPPTAPTQLRPVEHAGKSSQEKLAEIARILSERKVGAALITAPDSVAWTFNIRGRDVAHNPAPLARALIKTDGKPTLYIDGRKLSNTARGALSDFVDVADPSRLVVDLEAIAETGTRLLVDSETAAARHEAIVKQAGGTLEEASDPIALLKSRKNNVELDGARRAHLRDGVAMVRFLAWLDREAPQGNLDEIACVTALERFRASAALEDGLKLMEISFDTISGAGPNGAIVHYRVTEDSNRKLDQDSLLLVDSGGQYIDGTTDITRTIAIGKPIEEMRTRFSLVLKGHIAVADARFPAGVDGVALDAFARQALWRAGLDYDHGTGHGVGSYLSVHEGPPRISRRGGVMLEAGMIISNEPGYYKAGAYGIRIENLVVVSEPTSIDGGDRPMHSFETITLCPIDRRLIDADLLTEHERSWINVYHTRVRAALSPRLDRSDRSWLEKATAAI